MPYRYEKSIAWIILLLGVVIMVASILIAESARQNSVQKHSGEVKEYIGTVVSFKEYTSWDDEVSYTTVIDIGSRQVT